MLSKSKLFRNPLPTSYLMNPPLFQTLGDYKCMEFTGIQHASTTVMRYHQCIEFRVGSLAETGEKGVFYLHCEQRGFLYRGSCTLGTLFLSSSVILSFFFFFSLSGVLLSNEWYTLRITGTVAHLQTTDCTTDRLLSIVRLVHEGNHRTFA